MLMDPAQFSGFTIEHRKSYPSHTKPLHNEVAITSICELNYTLHYSPVLIS